MTEHLPHPPIKSKNKVRTPPSIIRCGNMNRYPLQEVRDSCLGKVFAYAAIVRSGRISVASLQSKDEDPSTQSKKKQKKQKKAKKDTKQSMMKKNEMPRVDPSVVKTMVVDLLKVSHRKSFLPEISHAVILSLLPLVRTLWFLAVSLTLLTHFASVAT